ncbi:MAG: hypothetical protein RBU45_15410 [Myxococcota bacterium]|jgi:hypothetical protein|nr:hypothetical protein [Myxococcota bacterium]
MDEAGDVAIHRVGADSRLILDRDGVLHVFYQDATTLDLLEAHPLPGGGFSRQTLAGDERPYAGAFGFYIDAATTDTGYAVVCHRIDRQADPEAAGLHLILRPPVER